MESLSNAQKQLVKENKKKNAKSLHLIQQGVADTIFPRIINTTKAKEAWNILQEEYAGSIKVRAIKLQSLRRDFENVKMKEVEVLKDYLSRMMYGENITGQRIMEKILISLPEKYDPIVAVIEETKDISSLGVQEFIGSIKTSEQRLHRHFEKSIESAFQSKLNVENEPSIFHQSKGASSEGKKKMEEEEEEVQEEEEKAILKVEEMQISLNQNVEFINEAGMLIKIVGIEVSLDFSIAKSLGMFEKIADLNPINKQTSPRSKKVMETRSKLVNQL